MTDTPSNHGPRDGAAVVGALFGTLLWQVYVVVAAATRIPEFVRLFAGLGVELPVITQLLFLSYRFWFLIPVIFLWIIIDIIRHPKRSPRYVGLVVFVAVTTGFVMQAWLYEGCLAPLLQVSHSIG